MAKLLNKNVQGSLIVFISVLWQGIGTATIGIRLDANLSSLSTFFAYFLASFVSVIWICFVKHKKKTTAKDRNPSVSTMVAMNLSTAGAFSLFYLAATILPPATASVLETSLGPFLVAVLMMRKGDARLKNVAITSSVFILALIYFMLNPANELRESLWGLILSIMSGVSAVGVIYSSKSAFSQGSSVMRISAIRYHLGWMVSGIVALIITPWEVIGFKVITDIAVLSFLCVSIPILLLQWGITIANALSAALTIAGLPAIVLGMQTVLGLHASASQVFVLLSILLITYIRVLFNSNEKNEDSSS